MGDPVPALDSVAMVVVIYLSHGGAVMAEFVEPKMGKPEVIYENENTRIVKRRTQIQTGEWNKELIIEMTTGTDAVGNKRWREVTGTFLKKRITKKFLHTVDWVLVKQIATIICEEKEKDDYDFIYYVNRERYYIKGGEEEDTEVSVYTEDIVQ